MNACHHAVDLPASTLPAGLTEQALAACPFPLVISDLQQADQPIVFVNHAFELLTGYSRQDCLGRNCRFLQPGAADPVLRQRISQALQQGDRLIVTLENQRKDGSRFLNRLQLEPLFDAQGRLSHAIGLQTDVGPAPEARAGAGSANPGRPDGLLLPDRPVMQDRLQQILLRAAEQGGRSALLLIALRLETLPAADDDPGEAGIALAARHHAPEIGGSLTRFGPSTYAAIVNPAPDTDALAAISRRLQAGLSEHQRRSRGQGSCHVGLAIGPRDGGSAEELAIAAQRALQTAQLRSPGGGCAFFADSQDQRSLFLAEMAVDLAAALAARQLYLVYQPIVQLENGMLAGFEALLRWRHPRRGDVPPGEFIPVAEACGLIDEIGSWVLDQALAQLAEFDRVGDHPLRMAVNIAGSQLEQPGVDRKLMALLKRHGIRPDRLELEITERTAVSSSAEALAALQDLRRQGVQVSVDDFGTGYSSLSTLTSLPVDTLKVDMSFTQAVTRQPASASVSRLICELARTLDLKVVVEGIETPGQLKHFRTLSCTYGQGWLFSRPLLPRDAAALLASDRPLFDSTPPETLPNLLIVDDEENVLSSLRRLFRRDGWRVHATTSPTEAFELLARHPISVVLSDQRMPQMSGTEFLRLVKRLHPQTVRMVLSGYSDIRAVTDAVNEGAIWRYLAKPWEDEALRNHIRQAFDEHHRLCQGRGKAAVAPFAPALATVPPPASQADTAPQALGETLDALPIALIAIDRAQTIVMSNQEADRLFGGASTLLGELLGAALPVDFGRLLAGPLPADVRVAGRRFRLHAQPAGGDGGGGLLLSFVPAIQL